jgi:beta-glucanase (GH16 family)
MAPPQAANAGFTKVLFNSYFATSYLTYELSCAGTPQTAPWKQGMWWEGQNSPSGVAPCSQINIVYDPVSNQKVLDLTWTVTGNTDTFNATTVSTFPLDIVSPHFAFRHGYAEAVLRVTPMATGVWPAFWTWSDNAVIEENTPPFQSFTPASEIDIFEAHGGSPTEYDAAVHEYYSTPDSKPRVSPALGAPGLLTDQKPPGFDMTKPHTYGLLWTSDGIEYQGGQVCAYVDNVLQGCNATTAATEAQDIFLILSMGVGCNYNFSDRSCLNGLSRADMLVSRVTVFGEQIIPTSFIVDPLPRASLGR